VDETLAGRGAEINECTLGVRVFYRGPEFNPRADPIVRVQTHHLRARLAQYYAKAGIADPLAIELPGRTYVPRFRQVEQLATSTEVSAMPVEQPAAAPGGSARGAIATSAAAVLVTLAVVGLMGRSWQTGAPGKRHDPDPVAQDLYIRGRYLLDRQTESALRQSIDCFTQSSGRDPRFAAAFAGLADAHNLLVQYGYMPPRDGMEEARRDAKHALALDPELAEAYVSLAAVSEAYDCQYRHAIRLNPELPAAHLWYGMFLRDQGRMREAMPELRRAEQLEPLSGLASINLAYAFRMAGDFNAALEQARRAVELNPELPTVEVMLANLYRARSDLGDADATLSRALSLSAGNAHALSVLACAYARLGRRMESAGLLHQMERLATERYVSPYDLGTVALILGDEDRADDWFEEAYRQRSSGMLFLRNEKAGSITHSPRLLSLIRKIGNG
jgi:Tfp pilus assembly protein PilF